MNYLIGKEDLEKEAFELFRKYPDSIKAIPTLLAVREGAIDVLIDSKNFKYKNLDFFQTGYTDYEINDIVEFIIKTGLGKLIKSC